jgi:hypothetical protein
MTLDVEMHSTAVVIGVDGQKAGGMTVTVDKDGGYAIYVDGNLVTYANEMRAGWRYNHRWDLWVGATPATKRVRLYTLTWDATPPSTEPAGTHPELEYLVMAVNSSGKTVYFRDKDTGAAVEVFCTFVKKDAPHIYNVVGDVYGRPKLTSQAVVPEGDWIMVLERRLSDTEMYYEVFDTSTIPSGSSTVLLSKKSEDLIKINATVKWDGLAGLFQMLLLYTDPLYWAWRAVSSVAPQHAVWLFNLLFTIDMPAFMRADLVAVRQITEDTFEFEVRVTPNSLKGWVTTLAKQLAKWAARLLFAGILTAGAYLIINSVASIYRTPAEVVKNINDMNKTLLSQTSSLINQILANPDLTTEQKIRAIEAVTTFSTNVTRANTQLASEIQKPLVGLEQLINVLPFTIVSLLIIAVLGAIRELRGKKEK